jgi:tetratricopeptide (TPR) repeat protein
MRWQQTEFLLKGVYLGLLVLVGLQAPNLQQGLQTALITLGGLVLCLGIAAAQKLREGYRVRGRLIGFILFLILENPILVYTGLLLGLTLGAYLILNLNREMDETLLLAPILGGAILGQVFWFLRHVRDRRIRLWSGLALAAVIIGGTIAYLQFETTFTTAQRDAVARLLLLGIPGFYLLTFAGMVEESEIESAAICSALGVGMWILAENQSPTVKTLALVLPAAIYFLYTRRILPGLRVFKHVLRGISYAKVGRYRQALVSLGRAIQLDPNNTLARETLWRVHQEIDFTKLINDPETLAVVDFDLCLERVSWLLLLPKPKPEQLQEAHRLLDLVSSQRPGLVPRCNYWRAVAFTHQGNFEEAATALQGVLAIPEKDSAQRRSVLLPAWQLAIMLHPEMKRRVGTPMLASPGGRMEAIAAVERQLASVPDDPGAWDLKRVLYSELTEKDYCEPGASATGGAPDFDHEYVHQLGLALLDDKERWQRGCEYLRIAGQGQPTKAPAFFIQMAKAHERAGATQAMWEHYQQAMQTGKAAKPANLSAEDKEALFAAVKQLGEHAMTEGKTDDALACFKFYTEYERAGLETYRTLAQLFEKKGKEAPDQSEDPIWLALHCTLHALTYDPKDKDLLERRDRYYYSISAPELKRRLDHVYKWFDVDYCKQKARWVLEKGGGDLDLLDWANHLVELAATAEPDSLSAQVLRARIQRMRGESDLAIETLEKIRANKPEKFKTTEEEEAWFLAHRLLGEMYVDDKPDQAVMCLLEFRNSPKSGANTMFNLGKAYENLGDKNRALRCYEQVVAFEGNPLVYDAQEAMDRLRGAGSSSFS